MKNICWYWSPFVRSRIFWRIFSPSFSLPHRQTRSEDGSSFFSWVCSVVIPLCLDGWSGVAGVGGLDFSASRNFFTEM